MPATIRQIHVPGMGDVPVAVSVRLVARHTGDRQPVACETAMSPDRQMVELPGAGQATVGVHERHESDGAIALRLNCEAKLDAGWVLYEAAICFVVDVKGWRLVLPSGWGREVADIPPDLDFVGNYPGWSALAQLVILQAAAGGLSVSARDENLELKEIRVRCLSAEGKGQLAIEIVRVPEKTGHTWRVDGPCDVLLATHQGGWDQAAVDYRHRQESVRPALRTPRPLSPHLAADPVWLVQNCFVFPPHTAEQTIEAARKLQTPTLCHFYNWQDAPFDTYYPDWVGIRSSSARQIETLAAAGIASTPYVNCRIWDRTTESWQQTGQRAAVRDFTGQLVVEDYPTTKSDFGVACPSQGGYHEKVLAVCRGLLDGGFGLAGLYLDQLGAAFGQRCYAAEHDHRLGGATSWNAGQRRMVEQIRALVAGKSGADAILTTENASEPLVDLLDGFLYYCGVRDDPLGRAVPLWHAIYGDCGVAFGDYFDRDLDLVDGRPAPGMLARVARQAIFGNAIGWISPQWLMGPCECVSELIRRAREARLPIRSVMRQGRLCADALDSTGEMTGAVQSAWRLEGRTVGLAVNPAHQPASFTWPDGRRDALEPFSARSRQLE